MTIGYLKGDNRPAKVDAVTAKVNEVIDAVTALQSSSGGSQPGAAIVRGPFVFAFDTADIDDGVQVYVPTVGDVLLNAWIEVTEMFDGTTPIADIGTINAGVWIDGPGGWFFNAGGPIPVDQEWGNTLSTSLLSQGNTNNSADDLIGGGVYGGGGKMVPPARFLTADPIMLVLSQDGLPGGDPIGGTAEAGRVYLVTATPASLP